MNLQIKTCWEQIWQSQSAVLMAHPEQKFRLKNKRAKCLTIFNHTSKHKYICVRTYGEGEEVKENDFITINCRINCGMFRQRCHMKVV